MMKNEWITGFDQFAVWVDDDENYEGNCGEGETYPFGPKCMFRGKEVPCFCSNSESGSITGQLLTAMLLYIGSFKVFD